MKSDPKHEIRRLRNRWSFSLRTCLFIGVPFAAVTTWCAIALVRAQTQAEVVRWVKQQGGHVCYDYEKPLPDGSYPRGAKPPGPKILHDLLGVDFFSSVRGVVLDNTFITDISPITKLADLESLAIFTDVMPNTDLTVISKLKKLEVLAINYTIVDSNQLERIKLALPKCEVSLGSDAKLR